MIAPGHTLSASGRDIEIDVSDPEEGVWLEKRTQNGYERVVKARLLSSDSSLAEFVFDGEFSQRKYLIAVYTRSGRGKDHKVVACRHEVSAEFLPVVWSLTDCRPDLYCRRDF